MDYEYLLVLFLLTSFKFTSTKEDPERTERCLTGIQAYTKNYFMYREKSTPIVIEVSNRIVHQLVSNIFMIFLKEILGYPDVSLKQFNDYMISCHVSSLFYENVESNTNTSECFFQSDHPIMFIENDTYERPPVTINLDTWVQSDVNLFTSEKNSDIVECGALTKPSRFGWFIPIELSSMLSQTSFHWTMFKDVKVAEIFDIPQFKQLYAQKAMNPKTGRFYCDEMNIPNFKLNCTGGYHIPTQCRKQTCALLLTSYPEMTGFVVEHIKELNLLVKVVWLGPNLHDVVNVIRRKLNGIPNRSVVVLSWTPSDLIPPDDSDYNSITFPPCEKMKSPGVGCKYDSIKVSKIVWNQLERGARKAFDAVNTVDFSKDQISDLLTYYKTEKARKTIAQISCEWLNTNYYNTAVKWEPIEIQTRKRMIYIVGIFPLNQSKGFQNLNGFGILEATVMAIEDINNRDDILKDYTLQLRAEDGQCQADEVVYQYNKLIAVNKKITGFIGPGCSDTLEPFTGLARSRKLVSISYSADASGYSSKKEFPYFFRTIGEIKQFKYVYLQMFQKFGWKRLGVITEDGTKHSEYLSHGHIELRKVTKDREPNDLRKYVEEIKSSQIKIIIVNLIDTGVASVMCAAYHLQMTAHYGYVWFLPYWLTDDWHLKVSPYEQDHISCTTEQMIEAIAGTFTIRHQYFAHSSFRTSMDFTVGEWRKRYERETKEARYEPSSFAGYAYDAIWTYAYALEKIDQDSKTGVANVTESDNLKDAIQNISFNGVSGPIYFPVDSTSRVENITIHQWFKEGPRLVGLFISNSSSVGGILYLNTSRVQWLNPDGSIPDDGTEPKKICILQGVSILLNVSCDEAVLIVFIFGFIICSICIATAVLLVKRRYDDKINKLEVTERYMKSLGLDIIKYPDGPVLDSWEISRDKVVINRKIGEGAFGTVYGGEANIDDKGWVAVAVKTLKVGSTVEEKLDFLSEAEMMKRFDHKNIVTLLGVCTKSEPIYTVMEFMLYGDLKTYLLARRYLVYEKYTEDSEISVRRLSTMALDVAKALSYLAQNKYVHRDIACRNCLVNAHRVVKVADFGMARPMFENDYYKFTKKGMLPVRWMAPESLSDGIFTPASDVWAFGIVLYEIITFGSFPYQGLSNSQVLNHVRSGKIIQMPNKIKPQLECLIRSCCSMNPKKRPNASEIVDFLGHNGRLITPCLDIPISSALLEIEEESDTIIQELHTRLMKLGNPNNINGDINDNKTEDTSFTSSIFQSSSGESLENQMTPLLNTKHIELDKTYRSSLKKKIKQVDSIDNYMTPKNTRSVELKEKYMSPLLNNTRTTMNMEVIEKYMSPLNQSRDRMTPIEIKGSPSLINRKDSNPSIKQYENIVPGNLENQ